MSIYKPLVIKQKVILAFSKFNSFLSYCSYNLFYNILCESIIYMDEETNQGKKICLCSCSKGNETWRQHMVDKGC